jgi:hypothetical protein
MAWIVAILSGFIMERASMLMLLSSLFKPIPMLILLVPAMGKM